eukprot:UN4912
MVPPRRGNRRRRALHDRGDVRVRFKNVAPLWEYLAILLSSVAASWAQYEALRYVSFPVRMLGKCFERMPVKGCSLILEARAPE